MQSKQIELDSEVNTFLMPNFDYEKCMASGKV